MSKFKLVGNQNYAATVFRIPKVNKLENSDKLYSMSVFGVVTVVDSSWIEKEGELALFFPSESKLSQKLLTSNNMYSDNTMNADASKKGYFSTNGRVRAVKLRGTISSAFVADFNLLHSYTKDFTGLKEGEVFDCIDDEQFVEKYVPLNQKPKQTDKTSKTKTKKAFKRVDDKFLPEHFSTSHYMRNEHTIDDDETIIVTQKLHGTSVRISNTVVKVEQTWKERVAKWFGVKVKEWDIDYVFGSRKVVKDSKQGENNPHFKSDIWTLAGERYAHLIPQNFIVYGELVGYEPLTTKEIQKGHTYGQNVGTYDLYVYRVAFINQQCVLVDLSWNQVKGFCKERAMRWTPELWKGKKKDFNLIDFDEKNFHKELSATIDKPVQLSGKGTGKDEGVCIRVDGENLNPSIYKYKNQSHLLFETKQLDEEVVDLESSEG